MKEKNLNQRINNAFVEIESRIQNGQPGVAFNILHRIVNTERNAAIDEAGNVAEDSGHVCIHDAYEIADKIKELKE